MTYTISNIFVKEIILKWIRFMEYYYAFLRPLIEKHGCV